MIDRNKDTEDIRKSGMSTRIKYFVMILMVIILAAAPLLMCRDAEFGGADGEAEEAITEIATDYEPWFSPILEPKSGEVESLLFALQAALGAGVIFYGIGYMKGRAAAMPSGE